MKTLLIAAVSAIALSSAASAQTSADRKRAALLRQRAEIDTQLAALDQAPAPAPASPGQDRAESHRGRHHRHWSRPVAHHPGHRPDGHHGRCRGVPQYARDHHRRYRQALARRRGDAGNGPRDVSVSVRGSNARNGFGARNIQVFEDDFPVTQPDGLARFDLTDPHAYGAVDVVRGPSSARYGNYALGGAVNFRTRRGRDIDGVEVGRRWRRRRLCQCLCHDRPCRAEIRLCAVRQLRPRRRRDRAYRLRDRHDQRVRHLCAGRPGSGRGQADLQ